MGRGGEPVLTNWVGPHGGIGVFPGWKDAGVQAMFSFRHDDSALGRDLDVGYHSRVPHATATRNRDTIAQVLGLQLDDFVFVRQVHGTDVVRVDETHRGLGAKSPDSTRLSADAIVTAAVGVPLSILTADCVPILFYDPVRRVIGAAHSGWRGTVGHIVTRVIESMRRDFGSQIHHIKIAIGPSIRRCCYEVDSAVADQARAQFSGLAVTPRFNRPGKYLFSMQDAIRMDLAAMGIADTQIEDTGLCTACRTHHLYSHRYEQGNTGRQMAIISLV